MSFYSVNSQADLARAILVCEAAEALGTAHLLRALAAGRIALLPLLPETSSTKFKQWIRLTKDRPAVALIGDDEGLDRGPNGWAHSTRAIAWARTILLHAAGAEIEHYEAAIMAAELTHRTLIIECSTAVLDRWIEAVKVAPNRPNTLVIVPREGSHPLPFCKEGLH